MEIFDIECLASSYQFLSVGWLRRVTANTKENGIRATARIPAGFGFWCRRGAPRLSYLLGFAGWLAMIKLEIFAYVAAGTMFLVLSWVLLA
jgi:hypothetical protein